MPADLGNIFDLTASFAEGSWLVEREIIHADNFGRGPQRNAVPAEQAGDLHIARSREQADENEVRWFEHGVIIMSAMFNSLLVWMNRGGIPPPLQENLQQTNFFIEIDDQFIDLISLFLDAGPVIRLIPL